MEAALPSEMLNNEKAMGKRLHECCPRNYVINSLIKVNQAGQKGPSKKFKFLNMDDMHDLVMKDPNWKSQLKEEKYFILFWVRSTCILIPTLS